jgi:hypothetical protein
MDNSFPTEQRFMASRGPNQSGGSYNSSSGNVPTSSHGFAPSNHTNNRHDWMGYGTYGSNIYYGHTEFPHPYGYSHPNHYYYNASYHRYHAQHDHIDRNSASFDEIPSPPHAYSSQDSERTITRHEMVAPEGSFRRYTYPPQYPFDTNHDADKGHSNNSSTWVTPVRSPKAKTNDAPAAETSKENSISSKLSSHVDQLSQPSEVRRSKTRTSSNVIWKLGEYDVLCGRGAPTNYHSGNSFLRKLVEEYQTIYLCSKRSDKPAIAWKLLDVVSSRGGRFVRRNKAHKSGTSFAWEQLNEKQAYEKICQALREGAPELRRRMLKDMRGERFRELEDEENSTGAVADQGEVIGEDEEAKCSVGDDEKKETKALVAQTRDAAKEDNADDVYAI